MRTRVLLSTCWRLKGRSYNQMSRSLHQLVVSTTYRPLLPSYFFQSALINQNPLNCPQKSFFSTLSIDTNREKSLSVAQGDQSYFDFKELECNVSADRRISHFMALMCEVFHLSEEEAEDIVEYYPFLWKEFCHKTFTHLKQLGLEKPTFMQNPWLITMPSEEIDLKLKIVSEAFPDLTNINLCASLFKFPNEKIEKFVSTWKKEATEFEHPSKFHFLAHALEVPIQEIMNQLETKSFLLSFPYLRIKEGVDLCLKAGVLKEDLLRDLWILRNRSAKIKNRIETLVQSKIPIKPWVLRTSVESFETHIQEYWEGKKEMEQPETLTSYLATRLKCSITEVDKMMKIIPYLRRVSIKRIEPNLDYLLIEKGIKPSIIIMSPRLILRDLGTVKQRVEGLEEAGIKFSSLWVVCKSQQDFENFVSRWRQSRQ